jgi:hypothetical protein
MRLSIDLGGIFRVGSLGTSFPESGGNFVVRQVLPALRQVAVHQVFLRALKLRFDTVNSTTTGLRSSEEIERAGLPVRGVCVALAQT